MQTKAFNVYDNTNRAVEEAYWVLRANIQFCSDDRKIHTLTIASCNPAEGKTTVAINLAIYMARTGMKVLLVDTDLRKPIMAKRLGGETMKGLSNLIAGTASLDEVLCTTNIDNLHYISCGPKLMNPSDLLASQAFSDFLGNVKEKYDIVFLDTPALSSVIDGALVASKTDATIMAIESGATQLDSLKRVKDQLEKANAKILGAVLNKVSKRDYKRYYESYNYFEDVSKFTKNSAKRVAEDNQTFKG